MIHRRIRPGEKRPGTSLVEFAFVAPVFFLIFFGVFEYARFLFTIQLLNNAAREGARYAVVTVETETTAGVQTYVNGYMAGQGASQLVSYSSSSNITVYTANPTTGANTGTNWQNAAWGDGIGVSVSGTYQPILPGFLLLNSSITVSGTCVISCEAN